MQLNFEIIKEVGSGNYPDLIQFADSQVELCSVNKGQLTGASSTEPTELDLEHLSFREKENLLPDLNVTDLEVNFVPDFGAIGGIKTPDEHKLLIGRFTGKSIIFERIPSSNVVEYELYEINYNETEALTENHIDIVPNPKTPCLAYYRDQYEWNEHSLYNVPEGIYKDTISPLEVFVNDAKLNSSEYTYSSASDQVKIISDTNSQDVIELAYHKDEVEHMIQVLNTDAVFKIIPIVKNTGLCGNHNISK